MAKKARTSKLQHYLEKDKTLHQFSTVFNKAGPELNNANHKQDGQQKSHNIGTKSVTQKTCFS
jgi:hypothetical protein